MITDGVVSAHSPIATFVLSLSLVYKNLFSLVSTWRSYKGNSLSDRTLQYNSADCKGHMMSRWFLTTVFGFLLAVATCQAGPKRNKYYNQVEDLMSNDVFEDDSFDRTGSRALSRAINVNVNPKTPLLFRTNVKKKPKKKNLQTRR